MPGIISYVHKDCFVHSLSGLSKLIFFLLWTLTAMLTYDTRVLICMLIISLIIFKASRTSYREIKTIFKAILFFLCINVAAIFLFAPYEGTKIYCSRTDLVHIAGNYTLTLEQLFYEANIMIKYFTVVPAVFMFITSTNPSEFASSLNKIKIPYTICYAIALALRYIPDVQNDFAKISNAQQARGIEMTKKTNVFSRIKRMSTILFPLIFTSMERIDTVSTAMELRGFGKNKKRTWYSYTALKTRDFLTILLTVILCITALYITYQNGSRFWNPFI